MRLPTCSCVLPILFAAACSTPAPTLQTEPSIAPPDGRLMIRPQHLPTLPADSDSQDTEEALQWCQAEYGRVGARLILLQGWAADASEMGEGE